jgi:hypothetical protein
MMGTQLQASEYLLQYLRSIHAAPRSWYRIYPPPRLPIWRSGRRARLGPPFGYTTGCPPCSTQSRGLDPMSCPLYRVLLDFPKQRSP